MDDREQRIWQRVTAPPRQEGPGDPALLAAAQALAEDYRTLGIQNLLEQQLDTVAVLKGLVILTGGSIPGSSLPAQQKQPRRRRLMGCYHQSRRAMAEYLARSASPETGAVYRLLSDRQAQHCVQLAALLGRA